MERDATGRRYFRKSGERAGGRVVHFFAPVAGFVTVVSATLGPGAVVSDLAVLGSRIDGPSSARRWALCTRRSRIASAKVGSPMTSCQASTGNWLVISVEPAP